MKHGTTWWLSAFSCWLISRLGEDTFCCAFRQKDPLKLHRSFLVCFFRGLSRRLFLTSFRYVWTPSGCSALAGPERYVSSFLFSWGDFLKPPSLKERNVAFGLFKRDLSEKVYSSLTSLSVKAHALGWCLRDLLINLSDKSYSKDNRLKDN